MASLSCEERLVWTPLARYGSTMELLTMKGVLLLTAAAG